MMEKEIYETQKVAGVITYRELIGGDIEHDQCRNVAKRWRQELEALPGKIHPLDAFSVGLMQYLLNLFFYLTLVVVVVVVVAFAIALVNLDESLLGVLEELLVGIVHLVELNQRLEDALLFLRGFLDGIFFLGDMGPPAGLIDLGGPGEAHDLLELAGEMGLEVGESGLGVVHLLVGGAGPDELEDGSGLGDVGDGAGHGGQHFRVGEIGHLADD